MKRWCVSRVVQVADPLVGQSWQAKVQGYGARVAALIPTDPATGAPLFSWCLVLIDAPSLTAINADAEIDVLPDLTLDTALSALSTAQRNALLTKLQNRGIDITGITAATLFRAVLRRVGQRLQAGWDENSLGLR